MVQEERGRPEHERLSLHLPSLQSPKQEDTVSTPSGLLQGKWSATKQSSPFHPSSQLHLEGTRPAYQPRPPEGASLAFDAAGLGPHRPVKMLQVPWLLQLVTQART